MSGLSRLGCRARERLIAQVHKAVKIASLHKLRQGNWDSDDDDCEGTAGGEDDDDPAGAELASRPAAGAAIGSGTYERTLNLMANGTPKERHSGACTPRRRVCPHFAVCPPWGRI